VGTGIFGKPRTAFVDVNPVVVPKDAVGSMPEGDDKSAIPPVATQILVVCSQDTDASVMLESEAVFSPVPERAAAGRGGARPTTHVPFEKDSTSGADFDDVENPPTATQEASENLVPAAMHETDDSVEEPVLAPCGSGTSLTRPQTP